MFSENQFNRDGRKTAPTFALIVPQIVTLMVLRTKKCMFSICMAQPTERKERRRERQNRTLIKFASYSEVEINE